MTKVFVQNLGFYCAWFSIQSLFKTMLCLLKRKRENHTVVLASDSSHEYTVDGRSISTKLLGLLQQNATCHLLFREKLSEELSWEIKKTI